MRKNYTWPTRHNMPNMHTSRVVALFAFASLSSVGCAQILGLDKTTKANDSDAAETADAAGICDVPTACAVDGSELCGQLVAVGSATARVANPKGAVCLPGGEGPCAVTVTVTTKSNLFGTFDPTLAVAATVDDCGRFKASPLPTDTAGINADLAVVVESSNIVRTATLVRNRTASGGVLTTVHAPMVPLDTVQAWVVATNSPPFTSAYLVQYPPLGIDRSTWQVRLDGATPAQQSMAPLAFYFSGDAPFAVLDPGLTQTGPSGTAIVVSNLATFSIGGDKGFRTCADVTGLHLIPSTLLFLDFPGC